MTTSYELQDAQQMRATAWQNGGSRANAAVTELGSQGGIETGTSKEAGVTSYSNWSMGNRRPSC